MNNSKLIIGISSRALFNLDESHKIFEKDGLEAYGKYQIKNEDKVLEKLAKQDFVTRSFVIGN